MVINKSKLTFCLNSLSVSTNRGQCYKPFLAVANALEKARVFVLDEIFQHNLLFIQMQTVEHLKGKLWSYK
jgi:hypothetical protein